MLTIPGVDVNACIYESANSLVYRALRQSNKEPVILKILKENYPTPQELARYRTEYQITKSLNLSGCIKAYDLQPYQNTLVMFVEDFGGESLKIWLKQKKFSIEEFLRIAIATIESLGLLHAANIIHKDINPSNIVFNPATGQLKIIDFGISTQFTRENPTLKNPNVLEGTLAYMSPEQTGRMNRSLDYRTDFYSLGITFYELLTNQQPFDSTDALELVHFHIAKQPLQPSAINPEISQILSEIVMKLMAKNAEERYQSAWGIKTDLETCLNQLLNTKNISIFPLANQDISDKFQIPQKLYGREREIEILLTAFERVSCQSELFLIAGYSGIGKSAIVQEIYKPITQKRGYFISGKFDQYQRNIPYSAVVSALQELVKQLLAESEAQLQEWRQKLLTALGINGQVIIDVIPEVELIIGKQLAVAEVGISESQNRFNLVFQNFLKVFIKPEHPLTIFIDDLQWADGASLKLIELLMSSTTPGLFLIGAYRDNEVSPAHPLSLTIEEIIKNGASVNRIFLSALDLSTVTQLISDTLNCGADFSHYVGKSRLDLTPQPPSLQEKGEKSKPLSLQERGLEIGVSKLIKSKSCGETEVNSLAELVFNKTGGNPFFMNEFLNSLYREKLLNFNLTSRKWQWNIEQIREENFTDNVVDLMLLKIQQLPENIQETLKIAACTGNQFELQALASICQKSLRETVDSLHTAIAENLVMPLGNMGDVELAISGKLPSIQTLEYKFSHDRIQQAAYLLIAEQDKPIIHRKIGQMLRQNTPYEKQEEKIFDIVNQLNFGISLITNQSERDELAHLNLIAGKKAKASAAYQPAFNYLQTGIKLLGENGWLTQYNLNLQLHQEAAEIAYLLGDFESMESLAALVLKNVRPVFDQTKIFDIKIKTALSQSNFKEGIKIGLSFLQLLGINLPENPDLRDVEKGFEETNSVLAGRKIEDLLDLPEMTQPEPLAALFILSSLIGTTYIANPNLMTLIVLANVNLSIKYGNSILSAFAYATYGVILCGIVLDIELGYQFSQLALKLVERFNALEVKAKVLDAIGNHVIHWKKHLKESRSVLLEAYYSAVETGDLEFIGYALCEQAFNSYSMGFELVKLEQEIVNYSKIISQFRQESSLNCISMYLEVVHNLQAKSNNTIQLIGDAYNEDESIPIHLLNNDKHALLFLYLNKLILCFLFEDSYRATNNAVLATQYISSVTGMVAVPIFHFYDSLVYLRLSSEQTTIEEKNNWLERVTLNQEKMQVWANHAPMNYLHKFYLVEAEKARIFGKIIEAIDYYDRAISLAKEHEYIQEAALAYELAAKFYLSREKELTAKAYMQEARYCYQLWGAVAKVKDLETRYPQLFTIDKPTNKDISTTTSTTGNRSISSLDIDTLMKASEAISGEIVLDKLLSKLMKIIIENVGAKSGCLILENQGKLVIEAECTLDSKEVTVLESIPVENCQNLPESIVSYVARTKEKVVLNDATCEGQFTNDPYIKNTQPKSILCAALMNQGQLSAIVYLENNLTAQAFTPERLQVLQLLSGQAAIAITNAKLYAEVKERENRLTQFINAMPIGVTVLDSTGQITYANPIAYQLSGLNNIPELKAEQLAEIGQVYLAGTNQLYPTNQLPIVRSLVGEKVKVEDMELHRPDKIVSLEVSSTPIVDETGKINYAIATFQDITERKQAEKLLADYNRTLELEVTERTLQLIDQNILQERNRMAREIHDTLAQSFTGIIVHLGAAERAMIRDSEQALSHMQTVRELAKTGLSEAKRSVEALRPQLLENSDLSTALNHIATQMSSHTEVRTFLEVIGTAYPMPLEVENNLLRIGQEALTNAFKYAKANTIQIELIYEAAQFSLRVKDNGQGFDKLSPCFSNGFGLLGMRERADRIGAQLTVTSEVGEGTQVIVFVKLD